MRRLAAAACASVLTALLSVPSGAQELGAYAQLTGLFPDAPTSGLFKAPLDALVTAFAVPNPWSKVKAPAPGEAAAIGSTSAGCLRGAETLPEAAAYQIMRPSRNRFYGHPDLVAFVRDLAARAQDPGLGPLLVGDLAQPRGGPTLSGHASHQTGLDADIWLWRAPAGTSLGPEQREKIDAPSMVAPGFGALTGNWKPEMGALLRSAAESPRVDRIFINPSIKRELCRTRRGEAWLGRLRPWWGHDDHFHVRLRCPAGGHQCEPQEPVPAGDGCGADLDGWFSRENRDRERNGGGHGGAPEMPSLPAACAKILKL